MLLTSEHNEIFEMFEMFDSLMRNRKSNGWLFNAGAQFQSESALGPLPARLPFFGQRFFPVYLSKTIE